MTGPTSSRLSTVQMTGPKRVALASLYNTSGRSSNFHCTPPDSNPLVHSAQKGWLGLESVVSSQGQWSGF